MKQCIARRLAPAAGLMAATLAVSAGADTAAAQERPNVVIINIDDMGWGDFGVYGSQYSQTPFVDALAAQGTTFSQFYASAPICSPSRAGLLTGQFSARNGINSFLDNTQSNLNRDNVNSLSLDAPSMPRVLQDAGYATGHFGKWHLGGGRDVGYAQNPTPGTTVAAPRIVEYGYDDAWTQFEGLANRILGFGDVMGLMSKFERTLSEEEAERAEQDAMRMLSGEFDFNDFYNQLEQISRLGSLKDLMEMMPFFNGALPPDLNLDDNELTKIRAIIQSMTKRERTQPDHLTRQPARLRRIAQGSGQPLEKVEQVVQQFNMMRGMMQQFSNMGGGFLGKLPGFKQLNTLRQMKEMDIGALFGDMMGAGGPGGMPGAGGGPGGGLANLPGFGGLNLPPGYTPPGQRMPTSNSGTKSKSMSRSKKKRKRKMAKTARKK